MIRPLSSNELTTHTSTWPKISQAITDKFEILLSVHLFEYNGQMEKLWQLLSPFKSFNFKPNQRIIFTDYDVQYFVRTSQIGLYTENLIEILYDLDISPGYCFLLTNHHGISKHIKESFDEYPMKVFENNYSLRLSRPDIKVTNRAADQINYRFSFMSHIRRSHRELIRLWIEKENLTATTIMAWHATTISPPYASTQITSIDPDSFVDKPNCTLIQTNPSNSNIRNKFNYSDVELSDLYQYSDVLNTTYRHPLIDSLPNEQNFIHPWLTQSFLNIVTETVFDYPYPYITEKTFKCFWHLSPFIIVGAPGTLRYLKSIGFRTFDRWFDESYDEIVHPVKRFKEILRILKIISEWSLEDCQTIYNDMEETLNHNLLHYQNHYCNTMVSQFLHDITSA